MAQIPTVRVEAFRAEKDQAEEAIEKADLQALTVLYRKSVDEREKLVAAISVITEMYGREGAPANLSRSKSDAIAALEAVARDALATLRAFVGLNGKGSK